MERFSDYVALRTVVNVTRVFESVHEKGNPRPRCPHHLRQRTLVEFMDLTAREKLVDDKIPHPYGEVQAADHLSNETLGAVGGSVDFVFRHGDLCQAECEQKSQLACHSIGR
jgi:hypothetical protein